MHTFETPEPTTLVVRTGAGHVTITAEDTDATTVELTALNSAGEEAVAQATRRAAARHGRASTCPSTAPGCSGRDPRSGVTISCPHGHPSR